MRNSKLLLKRKRFKTEVLKTLLDRGIKGGIAGLSRHLGVCPATIYAFFNCESNSGYLALQIVQRLGMDLKWMDKIGLRGKLMEIERYRVMLERNGDNAIGAAIAASAVYEFVFGECRGRHHMGDEWRQCAGVIRDLFGTSVKASELLRLFRLMERYGVVEVNELDVVEWFGFNSSGNGRGVPAGLRHLSMGGLVGWFWAERELREMGDLFVKSVEGEEDERLREGVRGAFASRLECVLDMLYELSD
ncbi:MAG TPA: hypothetical protein VLH56_08665 [Dissulfurispiraceae bacterium]|nr:hypothetical protein [Dissulfurispiraceae bacterium]